MRGIVREIIGLLLSLTMLSTTAFGIGKDAAVTLGWRPFRARTSFGDRTAGCAMLAPGYSLVPLRGFHCSFFEWPNSRLPQGVSSLKSAASFRPAISPVQLLDTNGSQSAKERGFIPTCSGIRPEVPMTRSQSPTE